MDGSLYIIFTGMRSYAITQIAIMKNINPGDMEMKDKPCRDLKKYRVSFGSVNACMSDRLCPFRSRNKTLHTVDNEIYPICLYAGKGKA